MRVSTLRHTTRRDRADLYDNDGDHEFEEDEDKEDEDCLPRGEGEGQGVHLAAQTLVSLSVDPSPRSTSTISGHGESHRPHRHPLQPRREMLSSPASRSRSPSFTPDPNSSTCTPLSISPRLYRVNHAPPPINAARRKGAARDGAKIERERSLLQSPDDHLELHPSEACRRCHDAGWRCLIVKSPFHAMQSCQTCGRAACDLKRRWPGLVQHPGLAALDQAAVRGTGSLTSEGSGGEMLPRLTEGGDNSRAPLQKVGRKRKAVHVDNATPLETSPTRTGGSPDSVGSRCESRSTLSPTPASFYNHDDTTVSLPLPTAARHHATASSESAGDKPSGDPVGEANSANNTTPSYTLPPLRTDEIRLPSPFGDTADRPPTSHRCLSTRSLAATITGSGTPCASKASEHENTWLDALLADLPRSKRWNRPAAPVLTEADCQKAYEEGDVLTYAAIVWNSLPSSFVDKADRPPTSHRCPSDTNTPSTRSLAATITGSETPCASKASEPKYTWLDALLADLPRSKRWNRPAAPVPTQADCQKAYEEGDVLTYAAIVRKWRCGRSDGLGG